MKLPSHLKFIGWERTDGRLFAIIKVKLWHPRMWWPVFKCLGGALWRDLFR